MTARKRFGFELVYSENGRIWKEEREVGRGGGIFTFKPTKDLELMEVLENH